MPHIINPDNTIFVLLSFEGPDIYSQTGGLGVRMSELSRVIAEHGFCNHFFFIGDPRLAGVECRFKGKQILHRWCQWISRHHIAGVYEGEEGKLHDWNGSLPVFIIENIIKPAVLEGHVVIILAEDWHTGRTVEIIDSSLRAMGLRDHCVIFWNANNEYGLHRINLAKLSSICTVTTVSWFMNRSFKKYRLNPLVIPNGIPKRIINDVDTYRTYLVRELFDGLLLQKVGRYDPDKRWIDAIKAIARLKSLGKRPHLIMRGGREPHRDEVLKEIGRCGLSWVKVKVHDTTFDCIYHTLRSCRHYDVLEMDFYVPEYFLMLLYAAADAVLANSGYEPFGIVGLEVMAQQGVAILGNTGEDYATHLHNSFRLHSRYPDEIISYVLRVVDDHPLREHISQNALKTARNFVWDNILLILLDRLEEILKAFNVKQIKIT